MKSINGLSYWPLSVYVIGILDSLMPGVEPNGRVVNRNSEIATARENGLAEGALDKALETARNMKADGLAIETISRYTGLTLDRISKL